jgi:hypothetical protein
MTDNASDTLCCVRKDCDYCCLGLDDSTGGRLPTDDIYPDN